MPLYEYQCTRCDEVTTHLWRSDTTIEDVVCKHCGHDDLNKLVSNISVHRNLTSQLSSLDPKYDKMVDKAMRSTPEADPNRHLRRMKTYKDD